MRFIDSLVEMSFRSLDNGTTLFFPFGILSNAFVIDNPEKEKEIKRLTRSYLTLGIAIGGVLTGVLTVMRALIHTWLFDLAIIAWLCGSVLYWVKASSRLTKGLSKSEIRFTPGYALNRFVKSYSWMHLLLLGLAALIMFLLSALLFFSGANSSKVPDLGLVAGMLFFGFCSVVFAVLIMIKTRG